MAKKPTPPQPRVTIPGVPDPVRDALVDVLGVDESDITPDSLIVEDLGADSLDVVEFGMSIEKAYKVVLEDQILDVMDDWTVKQLVAHLSKIGAAV